jgi:hypothetical protein
MTGPGHRLIADSAIRAFRSDERQICPTRLVSLSSRACHVNASLIRLIAMDTAIDGPVCSRSS